MDPYARLVASVGADDTDAGLHVRPAAFSLAEQQSAIGAFFIRAIEPRIAGKCCHHFWFLLWADLQVRSSSS